MSNYVKTTNFASKDALVTGNPNKVVKGTELDTEFNNIATASTSKANKVAGASTNNLMSMDVAGDLVNSGVGTNGAGIIDAGHLAPDSVGNSEVIDDSLDFTAKINVTSVGGVFSVPAFTTLLIPKGIYNLAEVNFIQYFIDGVWDPSNRNGTDQIISDGVSVRLGASSFALNVAYTRIY